MSKPKVSRAQVAWMRLRRSGLVSPFEGPEETAAALVGVQAQMPSAAHIAFHARTKHCSLEHLERARLDARVLVRLWGQRNTVHLYAARDWPLLASALASEPSRPIRTLEKAGLSDELERVAKRTERRLRSGEPLTYQDVRSKKLEEQADAWVAAYLVFMHLVRAGKACGGPDAGQRSSFVHREVWLPDLEWSPPPPDEACSALALRYLSTYGPAEARDLAFWFGTSIAKAKRWIAAAGSACSEVSVDGTSAFCLSHDVDTLRAKAPARSTWPVCLLPRFDALVLAHKDKSWLIDMEHKKRVWRPSAHVEAVLVANGRIAATWRYERKATGLHVAVAPFAPLPRRVVKAAEERAASVAALFGAELASFRIAAAQN